MVVFVVPFWLFLPFPVLFFSLIFAQAQARSLARSFHLCLLFRYIRNFFASYLILALDPPASVHPSPSTVTTTTTAAACPIHSPARPPAPTPTSAPTYAYCTRRAAAQDTCLSSRPRARAPYIRC